MTHPKGSPAEIRAYALSQHKGPTVTISLEADGYRASHVTDVSHASQTGLDTEELMRFVRRYCVAVPSTPEEDLKTLPGMEWWRKHDPERKDSNWGRTCICGGAVPAGGRYYHECRKLWDHAIEWDDAGATYAVPLPALTKIELNNPRLHYGRRRVYAYRPAPGDAWAAEYAGPFEAARVVDVMDGAKRVMLRFGWAAPGTIEALPEFGGF